MEGNDLSVIHFSKDLSHKKNVSNVMEVRILFKRKLQLVKHHGV